METPTCDFVENASSSDVLGIKLNNEIDRATDAERALGGKIDQETARATSREDELEAQIKQSGKVDDVLVDGASVLGEDKIARVDLSDLSSKIADNTTLINEETARATAKESVLEKAISEAGKIDDVRVNGESVVTDKIADIDLSLPSITVAADQLSGASVRLTDEQYAILSNVNYDSIIVDVTALKYDTVILHRATHKTHLFWSLGEGFTFEIPKIKSLGEDIPRRVGSVWVFPKDETDVDPHASAVIYIDDFADYATKESVDAEITRAKKAESDINSTITAITTEATQTLNALQTALTSEAARATTKENELATSISNLEKEAESSHATLKSDITTVETNLNTEISGRKSSDDALKTSISEEAKRAQGKESVLESADAALKSSLDSLSGKVDALTVDGGEITNG